MLPSIFIKGTFAFFVLLETVTNSSFLPEIHGRTNLSEAKMFQTEAALCVLDLHRSSLCLYPYPVRRLVKLWVHIRFTW